MPKKKEEDKLSIRDIVRLIQSRESISDLSPDQLKQINSLLATVAKRLPENMRKRAIEVGMRVDAAGSPYQTMLSYAGENAKEKLGNDIKYIVTGRGTPSSTYFTGLYNNGDQEIPIKSDVVSSVVYGTPIDSRLGKPVASNPGDYGILSDYVSRNYPGRDVQYVETEPYGVDLPSQEGIQSMGIYPVTASGDFITSIPKVTLDTAGFSVEYGKRNDSTFVRGFDSWDFASPAGDRSGYTDRWVAPSYHRSNLGYDANSNGKELVDIVDKTITPLVVKTPWIPIDRFSDIVGNLYVTDKDGNPLSFSGPSQNVSVTGPAVSNGKPVLRAVGGPVPVKYADWTYRTAEEADRAGMDFNSTWLRNRQDILLKNAREAGWKKPERALDLELDPERFNARLKEIDGSLTVGGRDSSGYTSFRGLPYTMVPSYERGYRRFPWGVLGDSAVHETAHGLGRGKPQEKVIQNRKIRPVSGTVDPYLDSATEIYSRLQEFRNDRKVDPLKTITKDDIDTWKKDTKSPDYDLLNRYSEEDLLFLFNDVAQKNIAVPANVAAFGGFLRDYKSGGKIHIKPSHRGRLTELKKRTGKSEAELYNDGNPAHKKMVVFARNARKWKHDDGGFMDQFSEYDPAMVLEAIQKIKTAK